jgi:hypothetical protein
MSKFFALLLLLVSCVAFAEPPAADERVKALEKAQQEVAPAQPDNSDAESGKATVTLHLKTADGSPPPKKAAVDVHVSAARSSSSTSLGDVKAAPDLICKVRPGNVEMVVEAEGYAPAFVEPFRADPAAKLGPFDVTLERGFTSVIRLAGDQGEPLPKARLEGGITLHGSYSMKPHIANDDGVIVFKHLTTRPYAFRAIAEGYEPDERRDLALKPDETIVWQLRRAKITNLIVTDTDNHPIPNATVAIAGEFQGDDSKSFDPWRPKEVGKTDKNGMLELNTLNSASTYLLIISAKDHGKQLFTDIKPGEERKLTLGPPLIIRGKITGDYTKLKKRDNHCILSYGMNFTYGHSSYGAGGSVPVTIKSGEAHFEIHDLIPCKLTFNDGAKSFDVTQSIDDLEVDLTPAAELAKRKVRLKFLPDGDNPPPRGTVYVQSYINGQPPIDKTLSIKDGVVEFDALANGHLSWYPRDLVGATFPDGNRETVEEGTDELEIEIPTTAAGAIVGKITDPDGHPVSENVLISVYVVERSPRVPKEEYQHSFDNIFPNSGKFMSPPLALDGKYVVMGHHEKSFVVSDPVEVTESQPMPEVALQLPKGNDVDVKVLDPDGKPLADVPIDFEFHPQFGTQGFFPSPRTDAQGQLRFPAVNPNAPGDYSVTADSRKDFRPAKVKINFDTNPTVIQLEKGSVLEGRLLDDVGNPIPNAQVSARPKDGDEPPAHAEALTDENGRFRFSNLADHAYYMSVEDAMAPHQLQASPGEENFELRVRLPGGSKLKPVKPKSE